MLLWTSKEGCALEASGVHTTFPNYGAIPQPQRASSNFLRPGEFVRLARDYEIRRDIHTAHSRCSSNNLGETHFECLSQNRRTINSAHQGFRDGGGALPAKASRAIGTTLVQKFRTRVAV